MFLNVFKYNNTYSNLVCVTGQGGGPHILDLFFWQPQEQKHTPLSV